MNKTLTALAAATTFAVAAVATPTTADRNVPVDVELEGAALLALSR
jgi:hypothetical protein